jgi:hypothetical protein
MSSTVQAIIDGGFAKSAAARPESFTSSAELISEVASALRACFQVLARENPYIISTTATATFNGTGWARPAGCLRVIKIMADAGTIAVPSLAVGAEIAVVPYDDQAVCAGRASLTELGQVFRSTGQSMDPSAGTLAIVYAQAPVVPTLVSETIDPLFPTEFDDYLKFDMAAYFAMKDKRSEDEQTFRSNQSALLQQIIDWSRAQTYSIVQRFPLVTAPLTNTDGGRQQPAKGA